MHLFVNQMSAKTDIRQRNPAVSCYPAHFSVLIRVMAPDRKPSAKPSLASGPGAAEAARARPAYTLPFTLWAQKIEESVWRDAAYAIALER
jgi:hypothetical protein